MKLLKKLSVVFILTILLTGIFVNKAHAAINCNVKLSTSKKEVSSEEKFSVYVKMTNMQTEKGIIAIGAVLEYDKKSLTLEGIEGESKWSDPMYNDQTGRLIAVKNQFATKDENVFKITFKVNKKAEKSAWVKVNNFEISDGNEEKNVGGNSITIGIKGGNIGTSSSTTNTNTTKKPTENSDDKNNSTSENVEENTNKEDEDDETDISNNEEEEQDNSILGVLKDDDDTQKIEEGETTKENKKTWGDYARYTAEAAAGVGVVAYIGHHIRKPKKRRKRR